LARLPNGGARSANPALMLTIRQLHGYIGAFIAPSVLFFAFTGSLQLFSLHEAHGGYQPPPLIASLGRLHKNQTLAERPRPPARDQGTSAKAEHDDRDHAGHGSRTMPWNVMALKWVFLAVAVGLIASTLLGMWLALTTSRQRGLMIGLSVAGAVVPLLLVAL
jgi:hypothetical protein